MTLAAVETTGERDRTQSDCNDEQVDLVSVCMKTHGFPIMVCYSITYMTHDLTKTTVAC